jgi:hypothetical protein
MGWLRRVAGSTTRTKALLLGAGGGLLLVASLTVLRPDAEAGPAVDPAGDPAGDSPTVERLREVELGRLEALVQADMDVAERLHADDFELVPPPGHPMSREQYLGMVASGELDYLEFAPLSEIEVRLHGKAASLWYRSRIDVDAAGQGRLAHEAWHLYLYERRDGQWQVVREQATAVGGFPPQPAG